MADTPWSAVPTRLRREDTEPQPPSGVPRVASRRRTSLMHPGEKYEEGFVARQPGSRRRIEACRQDDEVITMRVIRDNDKDDVQSDYHAGAGVDTVKRAIELATID